MHQDNYGYICLLIQGATKEDAGWYTVSAKNDAGIVSCTARLDVYSKWLQFSWSHQSSQNQQFSEFQFLDRMVYTGLSFFYL